MKDLKQSLASVTDAIGISENGDKPLWDARGYPGASAQFVLSRGQLGFCAGALFGSIAVPMTAYGARSQHHFSSLGALGKYALAGAILTSALAAYRISISERQRVISRVAVDGTGSESSLRAQHAQLGAGLGAAAGAALAKKGAMMKGALGSAAAGCLIGLAYHAYDGYRKNGHVVHLHYDSPALNDVNGMVGSLKRSFNDATGKL